MMADGTQTLPREFRSTEDGLFLFRFRGRDYVLTEEQALELGRLRRNSARTAGLLINLVMLALLAFLLAPVLGFTLFDGVALGWQLAAFAVLFAPVPLSLWRGHRRAAAALDGCHSRELPEARGLVGRLARKLDIDPSISGGIDGVQRRGLIVGVIVLISGVLLVTTASGWESVMEVVPFRQETIKLIGLILILLAMLAMGLLLRRSVINAGNDS